MSKLNINQLASMTDVDIDVKVADFRKKLVNKRKEALAVLSDGNIEAAVDAVFAKYGDVAITMPAVTAMALQHMGITAENYAIMADRVNDYIRNAPYLMITRGKMGGVRSSRAGVRVGTFGATCNSRVIPAPQPTHSRKPKRKGKRA